MSRWFEESDALAREHGVTDPELIEAADDFFGWLDRKGPEDGRTHAAFFRVLGLLAERHPQQPRGRG